MNKVELIGNNVREIELKYTTGETPLAVARFTLAVTRKGKKEETDFINCVAFGKLAETIQKYVTKGNKIAVVGRIQIDSYNDKDGNKKTSTNVIVEEMDFCTSKNQNENVPNNAEIDMPQVEDIDLPF